ncbi:MAG: hypothetical protein BWY83_01932 [bacterium ADurb.Bin478]|nr:MAG: hypothetical protein BWY83_01932 [bacterium ADurb.Bin478]
MRTAAKSAPQIDLGFIHEAAEHANRVACGFGQKHAQKRVIFIGIAPAGGAEKSNGAAASGEKKILAKTDLIRLGETTGVTGHGGDKGVTRRVLQQIDVCVMEHQVPGPAGRMADEIGPHGAAVQRRHDRITVFAFDEIEGGFVNLYAVAADRRRRDKVFLQRSGLAAKRDLIENRKSAADQ